METELKASVGQNGDAVALDFLKSALSEAQTVVRAYDTRAQIVGVGYVFALGIVGDVEGLLPNVAPLSPIGLAAAWLVVILPVLLFGYVLFPTRKSADIRKLGFLEERRHILYVDTSQGYSEDDIRQAAYTNNPMNEYSHELLVTSALRDKKRKRFLRGLFAAAAAFAFLFASQMVRSF